MLLEQIPGELVLGFVGLAIGLWAFWPDLKQLFRDRS